MLPLDKHRLRTAAERALVLFLASQLVSCASVNNIAYRADAAHPIRTVSVAPDVVLPDRMVFIGLSQVMAMGLGAGLGGAVGGAIAGGTASSRPATTDYGLRQSLRQAIADEVQKTGRFSVASSGGADAELRLTVVSYGFYSAGFMRRQMRPILGVRAQLVRRGGKVVWDQSKGIGPKGGRTPALFPEQIRDNPEVANNALRVAARIVAADLVATLRQ